MAKPVHTSLLLKNESPLGGRVELSLSPLRGGPWKESDLGSIRPAPASSLLGAYGILRAGEASTFGEHSTSFAISLLPEGHCPTLTGLEAEVQGAVRSTPVTWRVSSKELGGLAATAR